MRARLVLVLAASLLGACDEDRRAISRDDLPDVPAEPTHVVEVTDRGFEPDELTVTTEDLVEFRNVGEDEHGIRTEGAAIDTGVLLPGEATEVVFDRAGRYELSDVGDESHTMVVTAEPVPEG